LSLLGTFLVRSGVLTSVHAFATDPARGIFILGFLAIVIGGSLSLYAWRAPGMLKGGGFNLVSRETFLLINSALLTVAMATVLLGTVYPLIIEAFGFEKLSVGAPYFNAVFIPLMIPVTIVLGFGVLSNWRSDNLQRIWQHMWFIAAGSSVLGILFIAMLAPSVKFQTILAVALAIWITWTTLYSLRLRLRNQKQHWFALHKLPMSFVGMCLAHIGFAVSIIGICLTSHYSTELHKRMGVGDSIEMGAYSFQLEKIRNIEGPNYSGNEAVVKVNRGDALVTTLYSQKRMYKVRNMPMTEAGIDAGLFRDIYFSLGEPLDNGDWSVRLYYRPFVRWMWLGAIFMACGGLLATMDRRYRLTGRVKSSAADLPVGTAAGS
jgi:cytochrome c-type biogenesis protein CcmF